MRIALFVSVTTFALLGGCGSHQTNQANAQANASVTTSPSVPTSSAQVSTAPVDTSTAAGLIKQRKDAMDQLGKASKSIKRALDASSPDMNAIRQAAAPLTNTSAAKIVALFPAGTGPDVAKTSAKPDIWQNPQDFAQKARDYEAAAGQLNAAVASAKADDVKAAFGKVQNSCKACHDKYRAEDKH